MSLVSDQEWTDYKQKFNKSYSDDAEDEMRRKLYAKNKAYIEEHNRKYDAGQVTYSMGINHLADWTDEEKSARCCNYSSAAPK